MRSGLDGRIAEVLTELFEDAVHRAAQQSIMSTPPPQPGGASPQSPLPNSAPNTSPPQVVPIPPSVPPDGLHWQMRNLHGTAITLQFYSVTRRGFHWPAGQRAYLLTSVSPITI